MTADMDPEPIRFEGDGVTIVGERWVGSRHGVEVVLLHGGGQTRHSWKRTAERLAANGMVATVLDARGHGDSGWHAEGDYTIDGFVADVFVYIATLPAPPVLVGASLGGITSLLVAGENPGAVRALVLVDIVVRNEPAGVARIVRFMSEHRDGFATLEEVSDAIAAYNPNRPRPTSLDGLRKNVRRGEGGRWYWHWDPAFLRIDDEAQRHTDPVRLRRAASALAIPVLVVRGHRSDVVSDAALRDMQELVPQAQIVDIQAAGHMVAGDDNDVFGARLSEFVLKLGRRADAGVDTVNAHVDWS